MKFLNTSRNAFVGIGICDRCQRKFPITALRSDGNSPGLKVCAEDFDSLDPYRLPARQAEGINLPFVRPDVPLTEG